MKKYLRRCLFLQDLRDIHSRRQQPLVRHAIALEESFEFFEGEGGRRISQRSADGAETLEGIGSVEGGVLVEDDSSEKRMIRRVLFTETFEI